MKKFLLFICISIIVVACGVSIYYVVRNDENIYLSAEAENIYLNKGEEISIPVVHKNPNKNTDLKVSSSSDSVEIDLENWKLKAFAPGISMIKITSTNKNFGPFEFTINVGNGSVDYPYYVRSEEDLRKIGNGEFTLSDNYELTNNIYLTKSFTPIGDDSSYFSGSISGTEKRFSINNLKIDSGSYDGCCVGLFTNISENGRVENLVINNAQISSEKADFIGVVAGRNNGFIGKVSINNASVKNSNEEISFSGIVVGDNYSVDSGSYAEISLCSIINSSIKSASVCGGVCGRNFGGAITNNDIRVNGIEFYEGKLGGIRLFGGIAGFSRDGGEEGYSDGGEYFSSIVLNNLILLSDINSKNGNVAGVFGQMTANAINSKGVYSMLIFNASFALNSYFKNINDSEISNSEQSAQNYVRHVSKDKIYDRTTFTSPKGSTWDLKNTWTLKDDIDMSINYSNENLEYQSLPIEGEVFEIKDNTTLKQAINKMIAYPTARTTYKIMGTYEKTETVNESGKATTTETGVYSYKCSDNWLPIGTKENPFTGKIVAEDNAIIKIRNLNVNRSGYVGFFGYIKNAQINNLQILQAEIEGSVAGAVAGFNLNGTINNCEVLSSTIKGYKYSGAISGYSNGTISNCKSTSNSVVVEQEKECNIYIGGIVGKAKGKVLNSVVDGFLAEVTFNSKDNTVCVGGVVGHVKDGYIENSQVIGLSMDTSKYAGNTFAGGVVGYVEGSDVKSASILDSMQLRVSIRNEYSVVGGLAGVSLAGSKILNSSVGKVALLGFNVGGLVSFNQGEIDQCYAGLDESVEGEYVGGLVCNNYGQVFNSYSICDLKGSVVEAGFTTYLWKGSKIDHCYTYCQFSGLCSEMYAETKSNFKEFADRYGDITDSIVVGSNNQKSALWDMVKEMSIIKLTTINWEMVKKLITPWADQTIVCRGDSADVIVQVRGVNWLPEVNYYGESDLLGTTDFYAMFSALNFDEVIWDFSSENVGQSPILKNVADSGCGIVLPSSTTGEGNGEGTEGESEEQAA